MATRGISLVREEIVKTFVKNRGDVFRLRITAQDEVLMTRYIFAHQRTLLDPYEGSQFDEFCFIASPFDCTIYPVGEPDINQYPQFFRKDTIDILLASTEMAEDAWEAIREHVCNLVAAYNRLDALVQVETTRCGGELETVESVSESTSGSGS